MEDLSFEFNAPKNLKSKHTGSRKKFPELSSKNNPCNKENRKPTKSIKLWDPNEDIKKFLTKKPTKSSTQATKQKNVEKSKKDTAENGTKSLGSVKSKCLRPDSSNQVKSIHPRPNSSDIVKLTCSRPDSLNKVKSTCLNTNRSNQVKSTRFIGSASSNQVKSTFSTGYVSSNQVKSTRSTGYVSSNESYKMSTTYEFSGNSRDGSTNLSDDSLVQIFKSKLPTSVKIKKILTPRVNNVQSKSSGPETDRYPERSKKLYFTEGKSTKLPVLDQVRHSINFRNSTDFNTFATPLKTTNSKISTPTDPEDSSRLPVPNSRCATSPVAENENTKRQKVRGENFSIDKNVCLEQNSTKRTTRRNTSKQKAVGSRGDGLHNASLFSTLSDKSDKSLYSSLSPSPTRNCPSSLFSTISMESKESHDSSGSVYISAANSLSSIDSSSPSKGNDNRKKPMRLSKEKENCKNTKHRNRRSSIDDKTHLSAKAKNEENCKNTKQRICPSSIDDHLLTKAKNESKNVKDDSKQSGLHLRQLRSSVSSNESISLVNSSNVKNFTQSNNFDSRQQNDRSCSLISGVEKLNLTEEGNQDENLPRASLPSESLQPIRTANTSEVSNHHSSLFSSITSNVSRTEEQRVCAEVISISSDSSFDIGAEFSELNVKESLGACDDSKNSVRSNVSADAAASLPEGKPDTHASLYSTMGNANLTTGVKIRKSKYFFNASDKSISSIGSEPSCIESSIVPSRRNPPRKMEATPEVNEAEEDESNFERNQVCRINTQKDRTSAYLNKINFMSEQVEEYSKPQSKSIASYEIKTVEKSRNTDVSIDKINGDKWVVNIIADCDNIKLPEQNGKDPKTELKSGKSQCKAGRPNELKLDEKSRSIDLLFDKTKVFDGEKWVDAGTGDRDEPSFKFKEPTHQLEGNQDIDLSSWGTNSRGNVKIKVDRYSLNFNFNKLMGGKPDTTSTETLEHFSSDVKHCADLKKRKSFNRDLRKSIEIKRSVVLSSDSDADTDDEIRVVTKTKRKQRILDSSDESSGGGAQVISSDGSGEEIQPKSKGRKTKKCPLLDLTNEFDDILTIKKKPAGKVKAPRPVSSLDKKTKGLQLTAVPNTPSRSDNVSKKNKLTFLSSLSAVLPENAVPHPEAAAYRTKFRTKKEELSRRLFHLYNKEIFGSRLPADMPLEWNGRMRTTSGFCYNKRTRSLDPAQPEVRSARIALSTKILDSPDRLRDTLVHELCHAASWLIDGVRDGHGPNWKKWTIYAMQRFPELPPIKRCHDYKIGTKYVYRCSQCDYEFGRHSKSLNLERQVCGYCHGKFILLTNTRTGHAPSEQTSKRPPTQFAMFVKDNYAKVKQENAGVKHGDVMKLLSQKFAQTKLKDT